MKLLKILTEKKSSGKLFSIDSTQTLREAATLLCQHKIGALLVNGSDRYTGIITERDILRMCCFEGEFYNIQVSELMTEDLVTCSLDDTPEQVLRLMNFHNVRHIPVKEGHTIVGVLSIGDIIQELYQDDEIKLHDLADMLFADAHLTVY